MTHDELLARISLAMPKDNTSVYVEDVVTALRAVVELAIKQLDTQDMPAEQVGWFYEGYNLAMDNVLDAIEKELG